MSRPSPTAAQTVGPFFAIGFAHGYVTALVGADAPGERVILHGTVVDGDGQRVPDACLELWQPREHGFARVATDAAGSFRVTTVRPAGDGSGMAPHLAVSIFARGLLRRLTTRIYFPDEPANAADPILARVSAGRRPTLIARGAGHGVLEWHVVLQGPNETVFFDLGAVDEDDG